ncbi:hypothetical protein [Pseudomonas costantinii]|uniref:hypothetical protein n=1 Tax=Pseudomonas costantinii TaxID=168469 RepID=UPI0015A33F47|nr:hypothetical protein [Pseudomonas costantinii]NVZ71743.1 hypothetical protein [Pseudomonas costantinii]
MNKSLNILLWPLFSLLLLSGCGSTNYEKPIPYDQASTARIRLFGNNGLPVAINPGQDCDSSKEPIYAYGYSFADKFNSTLGQHTKRSVGMPPSWRSDRLSYGESYTEFVIPAGVPSVVSMKMLAAEASCVPDPRVFTPEAGKDYEAYLYRKNGFCSGVIQLLSDIESPDDIAKVPSRSCPKK